MLDARYMELALSLAEKAVGKTSPNPMVGAVIVKDGKIIGEGYHHFCGDLHAERDALKNCKESPQGADMYVTLEPCCHVGRQPPCVEAIIEAGIKRVFVGSPDPNPLVAGKGIEILRSHGIEVVEDVEREKCDKLNEVFLHYIKNKMPYVVLKYAESLDGKIACHTGDSRFVTGEEARKHVHQLRNRYRAIMVGINTVLADDPLLTCRIENGRNPVRIICDSALKTPIKSKVAATASEAATVIATCCEDKERYKPYEEKGCHVLLVKGEDGKVDLKLLFKILGENGIDSILVEGGGTLNWSVVKTGLVSKVYTYIAPKLIGGKDAPTALKGEGFSKMSEVLILKTASVKKIGEDILIESEVR